MDDYVVMANEVYCFMLRKFRPALDAAGMDATLWGLTSTEGGFMSSAGRQGDLLEALGIVLLLQDKPLCLLELVVTAYYVQQEYLTIGKSGKWEYGELTAAQRTSVDKDMEKFRDNLWEWVSPAE